MDMNEKMELTPEEKAAQAAWEAWNQKLQAITDPAELKAMIAEREAKMEAWKIERTAMEGSLLKLTRETLLAKTRKKVQECEILRGQAHEVSQKMAAIRDQEVEAGEEIKEIQERLAELQG